jgi:cell division protein FtsI/penicillin-binding protein 2
MSDTAAYQEQAAQSRRTKLLAVALATVLLVLIVRLAYWQLPAHRDLDVVRTHDVADLIQPARGGIVDATGRYLTQTTYACRVMVMPALIDQVDRQALANDLARATGLTLARVQAAIASQETEPYTLVVGAPIDVADRVAAVLRKEEYAGLRAGAVQVTREYRRVYPDGPLAAHVLGYVDFEGKGWYGLEQQYVGKLTGVEGEWHGVRNPWGVLFRAEAGGYVPVQDGPDLVLTLDRNVQYAAERILARALMETGAESGNILVMDPITGAIIAMAKRPSFEPGSYWRYGAMSSWFNNDLISVPYEPGSTVKAMTVAAALQEGAVQPNSYYDDKGVIEIGGRAIYNADGQAYGRISMAEMLGYSLNVGAATVAESLGPTAYYQSMKAFGFGEPSGIDLAQEYSGQMRWPSQPEWSMADFGRNAFGQGFYATPLQVATAFAALANDGMRMRPYIVAEVRGSSRVEVTQPRRVKQVVSPLVAQQTTALLAEGLELGVKGALVPGYRIAGKSGTSSVAMGEAGYENDEVITSFVGYGPLPNPRWVILVKFDKPQVKKWGIESAAPEFRRVFEYLVSYYGVEPTAAPSTN